MNHELQLKVLKISREGKIYCRNNDVNIRIYCDKH